MLYKTIITPREESLPLLEPYNPIKGQWLLRWVVRHDSQGGQAHSEWVECITDCKPTLGCIKMYILEWHNKQIDQAILTGHKWRGMSVWLSTENQQNYKASFDLAMQFGGQGGTLPLVYKFGSELEPVYHEFTSVEELSDFYLSTVAYVKHVLAEGWRRKDTIDWIPYEQALQAYE